LNTLKNILEMIRFSHTIFAMPFAILAAVMAWAAPVTGDTQIHFRWWHLVGIVICMIGARSAAMAFNRLVDRWIDAENPRTAARHLPAGKLSVASVWLFTAGSAALFFAGNALFLPNWLPLAVSLPVLLVLLGYSYTKRFTALAHFWLGMALALAPICAWVAIRGLIAIEQPEDLAPAVVLGLAVLFWVAGFDMIYACQDYQYDREKKLNSVPVMLGIAGALRLAAVCHAIMIGLLILLPLLGQWCGPQLGFGWLYWLCVVLITGLLIYEHALVKPDDLTRVNIAFFNVNSTISTGLLVVGAIDLLLI
jgi:4-hydroxybenzoate polyprenyltransferase